MGPATYDFEVYRGATFSRSMTWKDDQGNVVDLSTYTASMRIERANEQAAVLELSTVPGSGITLDDTSPNIVVTITADQTAAMDFETATYILFVKSGGGVVMPLLEGTVRFYKRART
jgi:hypothetical protein